ncbi:MAG: DUF1622 domain-containing protein [Erythrobacter sp.]|nr:DUF1622 domain-containing protein [Erythrobacter sp.]
MLAIVHAVARVFEIAGIGAVLLGALIAVGHLVRNALRGGTGEDEEDDAVAIFRRMLGRAILTGLELLVAADIILTVAVDPTLESVLVLGAIVLIRTFLSFSLEVEIDGRWPWQKKATGEEEKAAGK